VSQLSKGGHLAQLVAVLLGRFNRPGRASQQVELPRRRAHQAREQALGHRRAPALQGVSEGQLATGPRSGSDAARGPLLCVSHGGRSTIQLLGPRLVPARGCLACRARQSRERIPRRLVKLLVLQSRPAIYVQRRGLDPEESARLRHPASGPVVHRRSLVGSEVPGSDFTPEAVACTADASRDAEHR